MRKALNLAMLIIRIWLTPERDFRPKHWITLKKISTRRRIPRRYELRCRPLACVLLLRRISFRPVVVQTPSIPSKSTSIWKLHWWANERLPFLWLDQSDQHCLLVNDRWVSSNEVEWSRTLKKLLLVLEWRTRWTTPSSRNTESATQTFPAIEPRAHQPRVDDRVSPM